MNKFSLFQLNKSRMPCFPGKFHLNQVPASIPLMVNCDKYFLSFHYQDQQNISDQYKGLPTYQEVKHDQNFSCNISISNLKLLSGSWEYCGSFSKPTSSQTLWGLTCKERFVSIRKACTRLVQSPLTALLVTEDVQSQCNLRYQS